MVQIRMKLEDAVTGQISGSFSFGVLVDSLGYLTQDALQEIRAQVSSIWTPPKPTEMRVTMQLEGEGDVIVGALGERPSSSFTILLHAICARTDRRLSPGAIRMIMEWVGYLHSMAIPPLAQDVPPLEPLPQPKLEDARPPSGMDLGASRVVHTFHRPFDIQLHLYTGDMPGPIHFFERVIDATSVLLPEHIWMDGRISKEGLELLSPSL